MYHFVEKHSINFFDINNMNIENYYYLFLNGKLFGRQNQRKKRKICVLM